MPRRLVSGVLVAASMCSDTCSTQHAAVIVPAAVSSETLYNHGRMSQRLVHSSVSVAAAWPQFNVAGRRSTVSAAGTLSTPPYQSSVPVQASTSFWSSYCTTLIEHMSTDCRESTGEFVVVSESFVHDRIQHGKTKVLVAAREKAKTIEFVGWRTTPADLRVCRRSLQDG